MNKWNLFTQILIYYCVAVIIIYLFSDFLMFPKMSSSYQDNDIHPIKLDTQDGKKISAIYLKNPEARYTILFSHGNAEDIGDLQLFFKLYASYGFSIFAYDYHGYGTSLGRPSEKNTYLDIQAAYHYLVHQLKIPPDQIILHGRSIGTGPTLELAIHQPVRAIILESPMSSAFRVVTIVPIFPFDRYLNTQKITKISAPLLIIHGTQDKIISFWHGKHLYDLAHVPKTFYPVEGAGHNDLLQIAGKAYWNTIVNFVNAL